MMVAQGREAPRASHPPSKAARALAPLSRALEHSVVSDEAVVWFKYKREKTKTSAEVRVDVYLRVSGYVRAHGMHAVILPAPK